MKFFEYVLVVLFVGTHYAVAQDQCNNRDSFPKHFVTLTPYKQNKIDGQLKQCEVVKVWSIIQNGGAEYKINDVGKSVSEIKKSILKSDRSLNLLCEEDYQSISNWSYVQPPANKNEEDFQKITHRIREQFSSIMPRSYNASNFQFEYSRKFFQIEQTFDFFLDEWIGKIKEKVVYPSKPQIRRFLEADLGTPDRIVPKSVSDNVNKILGIALKQREILDMWDMCRYEQYKYSDTGDTKTSPICAIFNENDMEELEKMEKKEYNLNSEIKHVTDSFLKLMREDLKNDLPTVTAFFSGPSVFQLLLKKMNIETINEMSIASNLVIAKYNCTNEKPKLRFFFNEIENLRAIIPLETPDTPNNPDIPDNPDDDSSNNTLWIVLGSLLFLVVACIGGFFTKKHLTKTNEAVENEIGTMSMGNSNIRPLVNK